MGNRLVSEAQSSCNNYIFIVAQSIQIKFPHSDIFGFRLEWQLPKAYRSLLRPSSISEHDYSLFQAMRLVSYF